MGREFQSVSMKANGEPDGEERASVRMHESVFRDSILPRPLNSLLKTF